MKAILLVLLILSIGTQAIFYKESAKKIIEEVNKK
jgi:hypothetical protein